MRLQLLRALLFLSLIVPPLAEAAVDLRFTLISERDLVSDIRNAGDGSGRLFLVSQDGLVFVLGPEGQERTEPFLDLRDRVTYGGERGLLSVAFAPDYAESGHFYAWYSNAGGDTVLSRFTVSENPDRADAASEEILLTVAQPRTNHNGGRLLFGPDGYLYLGTGDGGGGGDPFGNGQNLETLLGKILRLDVDPALDGYGVPPDNPLVGQAGADELWAWGLRNPWRMSFDRLTGDLYIADVGQNRIEEVSFQPALAGGGRNYGWPIMEGSECYPSEPCDRTGLVLPVAEYTHDEGCSISGGEVYRGNAYPDLNGVYLYSDFCTGTLWGLRRAGEGWRNEVLGNFPGPVVTFGEGEDGALYLAARGSGVYRIGDGAAREEPAFAINALLNDAWFNPSTPGQGVFLVVLEPLGKLFLAWFTFDVERPPEEIGAVLGDAGHRWLTALGDYAGDTATLEVELTRGGVFDRLVPQPEQTVVGTMTVKWTGCDAAAVTLGLPDAGLVEQLSLRRIARDNVAACEAASAR